MKIATPIQLPCGATLPNRIAKSAMSENMAQPVSFPGENFKRLYQTWIQGGAGLCITGNVMIDSRYLGEPHNVVIEEGLNNLEQLRNWAEANRNSHSHIWVQLNHPGKQTPKFLTPKPVAPSSIALNPPLDKMFNPPRELEENEIFEIIERFAYAAKKVKEAGFQGVQIHGAHGYLVSQFLSPLHNKRQDQWGGSTENRMRFVVEVYKKMREEVGKSFPIGIKINSADFSKGGFDNQEAIQVTQKLSQLGIDLIELSGGSYQEPVMTGKPIKESTKKREAYFLEFAQAIREVVACPLMVTGGFRTAEFMKKSIEEDELDIVGLGRSLCLDPQIPNKIFQGEDVKSEVRPLSSGFKLLDLIFPLEIIWYTMQIHRLGAGKKINPRASVYRAIFNSSLEIGLQGLRRVRS